MTEMRRNRRWLLKKRPEGPVNEDCFEWAESEVGPPDDGQMLIRNLMLSFDPTQRGWYKKRHRPITRAQKGALRRHWPALGVDLRFNETLDLERYHAGAAGGGQEKSPSPHTILDVGFGKGEDLVRSERAGCRICMSAIHTHTLVRSERARCRVRMHVTHTHTHTHTNAQVQMSGLLPHAFLLGIEIHRASIATAVAALAAAGRRNVRVCRGDLALLLRQVLKKKSMCVYET